MKDIDDLKNELQDNSPFLTKMKEEGTGFEVPKDYFKKLPDEIIGQLNIDNQPVTNDRTKSINWFDSIFENLTWFLQPRPAMAFASILLLIVAGLFFLNAPNTTAESISLSDISVEELEHYLDANIDEFDAEILVQGNENLLRNSFEKEDELDAYFDEIIEESDLEDLL